MNMEMDNEDAKTLLSFSPDIFTHIETLVVWWFTDEVEGQLTETCALRAVISILKKTHKLKQAVFPIILLRCLGLLWHCDNGPTPSSPLPLPSHLTLVGFDARNGPDDFNDLQRLRQRVSDQDGRAVTHLDIYGSCHCPGADDIASLMASFPNLTHIAWTSELQMLHKYRHVAIDQFLQPLRQTIPAALKLVVFRMIIKPGLAKAAAGCIANLEKQFDLLSNRTSPIAERAVMLTESEDRTYSRTVGGEDLWTRAKRKLEAGR
jgi:hypothetical protein